MGNRGKDVVSLAVPELCLCQALFNIKILLIQTQFTKEDEEILFLPPQMKLNLGIQLLKYLFLEQPP